MGDVPVHATRAVALHAGFDLFSMKRKAEMFHWLARWLRPCGFLGCSGQPLVVLTCNGDGMFQTSYGRPWRVQTLPMVHSGLVLLFVVTTELSKIPKGESDMLGLVTTSSRGCCLSNLYAYY
jgi:hypothetical protein